MRTRPVAAPGDVLGVIRMLVALAKYIGPAFVPGDEVPSVTARSSTKRFGVPAVPTS